jgi:hypothetical protein
MPIEGMVDALRRARDLVRSGGSVVDVHPTAAIASVHVGDQFIGPLDAAAAAARHAAADRALAAAIKAGLFEAVASADFLFCTYGDTIEELRDHIGTNWRDSRISDGTVATARSLAAHGRLRASVTEHVQLTTLRPSARRG